MAQQILSTNTFTTAKWIVSNNATTGAYDGTHTTIASALTSASSGDTIFIRPGTYTENLTLKAGVNLTAFESDSSLNQTGNVTIVGKCTFTGAGTVTIANIELQTNSDYLLAVTGSAASLVNLVNCNLNMGSTGIDSASSSASSTIYIFGCTGNLSTTGIGIFSDSSAGVLQIVNSLFNNNGASTTASTISAGNCFIYNSTISNPITVSSTGAFVASQSNFYTSPINSTSLTLGGSGSQSLSNCAISGGTASAISIGSTATIGGCVVQSTNTNAITGAGTINNAGISFTGSSSLINTTTQVAYNIDVGGISFNGGLNTLANYILGTFTPTFVGGSVAGTTTYTVQNGYYVRVGSMVQIQANVQASAATGTGSVILGGLPFTVKNQTNGNAYGAFVDASSGSTWPVGSTSLAVKGAVNTATGSIYVSGTGVAGGFLQMFNGTTDYEYTLVHQI
jgi:hypothetical protein